MELSQLQQLKRIELEMLKEFVSVCERLHLKYYLMYGTLLGAVRHQGFIPWDDDIDVAMRERTTRRFLKKGKRFCPNITFCRTEKLTLNGWGIFPRFVIHERRLLKRESSAQI